MIINLTENKEKYRKGKRFLETLGGHETILIVEKVVYGDTRIEDRIWFVYENGNNALYSNREEADEICKEI
jgi:hypothetical protein